MLEEFKKSSKKEWVSAANSDLKGADVFEKYNWQLGSVQLAPYYDASDIDTIDYLNAFRNRLAKDDDSSGDPRMWYNLHKIEVLDEKSANAEALLALMNGADGIDFHCEKNSVDVVQLLNDILPEFCFLSFKVASIESFSNLFNHFQKIRKKNVSINLQGNEEIEFHDYIKLNHSGIRIINIEAKVPDSFEQEISDVLQEFNKQMRLLMLKGIEGNDIINSLTINSTIGTDFFGEIAKVRSIRNLVYQIIRAYGVDTIKPEDIFISCVSPVWSNEKYNPHANMLKGSTAGFAAILGGCNALVVESENNESLSKRIARNVSNILKEESYLAKVADPVAGSYFIEKLTDELSKKAWTIFQNEFENQISQTHV